LALVAVMGRPTAATNACASECGDTRTATQPLATIDAGKPGRAGKAKVSGPGQCCAIRRSASGEISLHKEASIARPETSNEKAFSASRPFNTRSLASAA
jgi:hypothetical protein